MNNLSSLPGKPFCNPISNFTTEDNRSGFTPLSHDPPPSGSNPGIMVFPPKELELTPHLSTPTQSKPTVTGDDQDTPRDFTGRGKRLTISEQKCLIRICEKSMNYYEALEYPKSFWIKISEQLLLETGRKYSWQSCRRRIHQCVERRKAFWAAHDEERTLPSLGDMNLDIADQLDEWMEDCEDRLEAEEKAQKEKLQEAQRRQAEKTQQLEAERFEVQQTQKLRRTLDWVNSLPPKDRFEPLPRHWDVTPDMYELFNHTRTQIQPLPPNGTYGAKLPAPVQEEKVTTLDLVIKQLREERKKYRSSDEEEKVELPLPLKPQTEIPRPEVPDPGQLYPPPEASKKRPREPEEADAATPDRPAQRRRGNSPDPSNRRMNPAAEKAKKSVDDLVNNLFIQFCKAMIPFYDSHKDDPQAIRRFSLVMYDSFREISRTFSKALVKMMEYDEGSESDDPGRIV